MKHIILALSALALSACSSSLNEPRDGTAAAVVTVVFSGHPQDTLDVLVTDSATIAGAEAYVATKTGARMITGTIAKGAGQDTKYPFHFIPSTVRLADFAMELCDGEPMRTPQAVNTFFEGATGNANSASAPYCPWGSYPIAVSRIGPA
jgi:hypothetical protein